ncbi:MAG: PAS domain S-box protein [Ignavibacteriae bacterium]|nr:PAS domain S-box protein [Ignavibacteriota bacterium]
MNVIKKILERVFNWGKISLYDKTKDKHNDVNVKLHPIKLRFPDILEHEFLNYYHKNAELQIKISSIIGSVFFIAFFPFDLYLVPHLFNEFFTLRVVVSLFIVGIAFTSSNLKNSKLAQILLSTASIIVGAVDISFIVIAFPKLNDSYYVGIILIYFWSYVFLKLKYFWAAVAGFSIFFIYEIVINFIITLESQIYFISSFYLFAANIAGIGIAYALEYYSRREYYQQLMIKNTHDLNFDLSEKISESKKVISQAQEKLMLQSKAIESAANSILIINRAGKIIFCNSATSDVTGFHHNEIIGKNPRILKSGKHDDLFYKNMWNTVLSGKVWSGEIINKKKNGELYYEEMVITPVNGNGSNKITHFVAIKQDITLRKNMEKDLFESEKRFRGLFENATRGLYRTTENGKVLMMNNALFKMLGYNSFEEMQNTDLNSNGYVNPSRRKEFIDTVKSNGNIIGFESEWRKKDGSKIFISESARKDFDEFGNLFFEGTVEDITKRKLAELELQQSKELLQKVFDNVYNAIFIHDVNGKVLNVNDKVLNLYNVTISQAKNLTIQDFSDVNNPFEKVIEMWKKALLGETFLFEWKAKRPFKNLTFDVEVFLTKISINQKDYILANVRDITEQKRAEEALISAKEMAEKSDKTKSNFLAGMSHEIRTPINTILNFISLIKSDLGENINEDTKSSFEMIDSGSRRLIRTIDSIINMSQLQAGSYELKLEELSIVNLISPLYREFKLAAEQKNLKFELIINSNNPNINADSYTITQLFINLIDNAIKYTKVGSIIIEISDDGNFVVVKISDSGIGISEEFLPTLFEPFFQEEMGYTRSFEGNGLGLALVKKYIELNNGIIYVESKKGIGSTFTVKLLKSSK